MPFWASWFFYFSCIKHHFIYIFDMILRLLFVFVSLGLIVSCSGGNNEENLAKLDKVYGPCDNPYRQYTEIEKQVCRDKVMAAGPDGVIGEPINILDALNIGKNRQANYIKSSDTNNSLWDASLAVLGSYSLKLSDYDGGYIETNWIINKDNPSQRCLIKSHIKSSELVSNGVEVTILCENKIDNEWYSSNEDFVEEEKQLTLKILQEAASISSSNLS